MIKAVCRKQEGVTACPTGEASRAAITKSQTGWLSDSTVSSGLRKIKVQRKGVGMVSAKGSPSSLLATGGCWHSLAFLGL